ncbi:MAG: TonB family protein, partial [Myxococcales bacterium]|nr:TonB family protein [Myxococcales bacterium]
SVRVDGPEHAAPPPQILEPAVLDVERPEIATPVVPAAPPAPMSAIALAPSASSSETVSSASRDAGDVALEATRQVAALVEAARLEAERREAARQAEAQREAERQEAARQEAARVEAARLEAERRETARQAEAQLEAERQEAARQEAARVEAARLEAERRETARQAEAQLEAERQKAARQEAARIEAARLEAERREAARLQAEQKAATRREAVLRAIGRQLDEEASRREAASTAARQSSTLPLSLSTARRARLWGRSDPNVELVQYAEAWALKIQFNTAVDTVREVAKRPHTTPVVTVAIRSDGSVESVTFVLSSGVAEVDEAIRRIVQRHAHYPAFPPGLASEFDVVEIRRTWHFDTAVRLD